MRHTLGVKGQTKTILPSNGRLRQLVVDGASALLGEIAAPRFGCDRWVREARMAAKEAVRDRIHARTPASSFVVSPSPCKRTKTGTRAPGGRSRGTSTDGAAREIACAFELEVEHVEALGPAWAGHGAARGDRRSRALVGGGEERARPRPSADRPSPKPSHWRR